MTGNGRGRKSTDRIERGSDPAVLDPSIDHVFVHALRASQCKLMISLPDGQHGEVMLPRGEIGTMLKGTHCYMNLEATAPDLRGLLRPSQVPAGAIDRVNAYVSPPHCGTPLHFDIRTVWIVQLFGRKTWMVADAPVVENPHRNCVAPGNAEWADYDGLSLRVPTDLRTIVLQPGDWLLIPKAVWHKTFTTEGSVSASLAAPEAH